MSDHSLPTDEAAAQWAIDAYEVLRRCRDLVGQLAPAAPLLDELDDLVTAAEDPWPAEEDAPLVDGTGGSSDVSSTDPDCVLCASGAFHFQHVYAAKVPEHQRDALYEEGTVTERASSLPEIEEQKPALSGTTEATQALALALVLCRMLLENNGQPASGAYVNEALSIVEDLWALVPDEHRRKAAEHAAGWEEQAGW